MPKLTIIISLLLILLGLIAYFGLAKPDERSLTALIPGYFGLPILLCGLIALKSGARKVAMHVAMLIAFLGVVLPLYQLIKISVNNGFSLDNKTGTIIIMIALCLFLLIAGIRSFVVARKA